VGGCWESALVRVTHWLPTLPHAAVLRGPALEQPRVGYSTEYKNDYNKEMILGIASNLGAPTFLPLHKGGRPLKAVFDPLMN
ncbi:MAG: hypothetical protein K0M45_11960, partial [Candidatus Paracaedibacteraceae bacterium]|nr:hypothetical protein [Candidatus Paracaedibacteraceae bacterium]